LQQVEAGMSKFGESQAVKRFEDRRFLTGHGRYVDDIAPADAWHVLFLRSPVAHAEITGLDLDAAHAMPGIKAVLSAAELEAEGVKLGLGALLVKNRDGSQGAAPLRPALARGRVRFVGEPVVAVVAETIDEARDAIEAIGFDYDELPVHMELAPGGDAIHAEAPGNVAFDWAFGDEDATHAAFEAAAHRVKLRLIDNRIIVNSMEPRGAFAEWQDGRLHLAFGGQGVWGVKGALAKALGLDEAQVRVTNPDVGGGFGMKAGLYPEYIVLAAAARMLGHPVRWFADRTEAMLSDSSGRDLVSTAELAFDENLRIRAYRVNILTNLGAYNSGFGQWIQSEISAKVLTGTYDVQTVFVNAKGIYTNTTQTDAYRGAGRPEAIYTLERAMDMAARELGVDPFELRRRNFIAPLAFPYRSAAGELYDVGDFARVLARLEDEADVAGFEDRRAASERDGKLRGMGLCYYIEAILGNPTEGTAVEFRADGTVNLYVGTQSNGQGHETVYAQFLADRTGIPVENITVVQGDSDRIAKGGGTGGSRSVTTQTNSALVTVEKMIGSFTPFLAEELGAPPEFSEGAFRAPGSNRTLTLIEAADLARAKGREDLLRHEETSTLPGRSYPNGAHLAEVEVDPDTGHVQLVRYTVVDDFGNLMHPMLAEGQVHGGVVQGFGQAVMEHVGYDEDGQLLTATFMDYALPRAQDVPMIRFISEPVPSTANPLGMKGCGEAGTVGALAAVANAVLDALWAQGVRKVDMPFTPARVWGWLEEARAAS
jgi:aerobic carbon-monoxide dehydrogenase large subunit